MNIQQTSFSHKVIGPDATAAAASAGAARLYGRRCSSRRASTP